MSKEVEREALKKRLKSYNGSYTIIAKAYGCSPRNVSWALDGKTENAKLLEIAKIVADEFDKLHGKRKETARKLVAETSGVAA